MRAANSFDAMCKVERSGILRSIFRISTPDRCLRWIARSKAQMALHYISSMRAQKAAERLQQNIIGVVVPADIHKLLDLLV